jgi:hypothetical protein
MPAWLAALLPRFRKIPWTKVAAAATWLYTFGKARLEENLTKKERSELTKLVTKSKGRPSKLTERERTRFRRLVYKGLTGRFPS